MSVCVVVTRGGAGDLWWHGSVQAADDHPITQLGDALLRSPEDVLRTYTRYEMAALAERLGGPQLQRALLAWEHGAPRSDMEQYAEQLWALIKRSGQKAPTDDSEIVRVIRADRRAIRAAGGSAYRPHPEERGHASSRQQEGRALHSQGRRTMSDTEAQTEKKSAIRAKKFSDDAVIGFGKDKDGNAYSAENNPKKPGSKAQAAFANYREGETVKALLERGGTTRGDINYDVEKGYIVLA